MPIFKLSYNVKCLVDMWKRSFLFTPLLCVLSGLDAYANDSLSTNSIEHQTQTDSVKHQANPNFLKKIIRYFEDSNEVDPHKKFDISFVGGPHYSSDTKLGVGLVASGLYRLDQSDFSISPSNVSLYGDFTTSGSVVLGVSGNTLFPKDKYRLDFDVFVDFRPSKYWGIGYARGNRKHDYTKYTKREFQLKADFLRKILEHAYLGVTTTAQYVAGKSFRDPTYLAGEEKNNTAIGLGVSVGYDSRDFIPNPYRGIYVKLEQNFYPSFLGSSHTFSRTDFIFRHYRSAWKGAVVALDAEVLMNHGNVPWSMMALVGSSHQMRGYYNGQYRDKKMWQTQVELRQHIHGRSGAVLWAGAGNCFSDFDRYDWSHTLPTFGVGYRWEFKNRVNVRLDYGIGKGQSAFYFQINEAF